MGVPTAPPSPSPAEMVNFLVGLSLAHYRKIMMIRTTHRHGLLQPTQ